MSQHLVHGMGVAPAAPDWPPLTVAELDRLLARYPEAGGARRVDWRSPRPLSAAALVRAASGAELFVKRHHVSVRTERSLVEEHGLLRHLAANDAPVVRVLADEAGRTAAVSEDGRWTYEVHTVGAGEDVYRDAISWSPFQSLAHARSAGHTLARLHEAAKGYDAPNRTVAPLIGGFTVFGGQADPIEAARRYAAARPALADYLARRGSGGAGGGGWTSELERWHLPFYAKLRPHLAALEPLWTHNDLHASNLLWRGADAVTVIDFNLADRAFAVHDLALAIERNAVEWVELAEHGRAAVHADAAVALIAGYEEVRRLSDAERIALPELLPLCHVDFALSELDYFAGVTRSAANADLAYRYVIDHTAWFTGEEGSGLLRRIRLALRL
ncbi:MAG TPA: phosphotransferase [Actinospica sp.]|nr:phosphotransferase [Actinospica sp.]